MTVKRRNIDKKLTKSDMLKRKDNAKKRGIPELESLALAINQRLVEMEKNQEWLAAETEIGKATISAYYNAESLPNGINLLKLAKALQTTPDYLLGFTNTPTTNVEVRAINELTGLSEGAIYQLTRWKDGLSNPKSGEGYKTFCNDSLNFISKLIIHHLMGVIPMRMSEIRLERERREAMEGKLEDEKDMSTLFLHNVLAYEQAQKHNQTVTGTRMIPAADYESYLLNDITTTFRKIIEDILSDNK
jgi:transcriptional regulator with XRE-family HTH domain